MLSAILGPPSSIAPISRGANAVQFPAYPQIQARHRVTPHTNHMTVISGGRLGRLRAGGLPQWPVARLAGR